MDRRGPCCVKHSFIQVLRKKLGRKMSSLHFFFPSLMSLADPGVSSEAKAAMAQGVAEGLKPRWRHQCLSLQAQKPRSLILESYSKNIPLGPGNAEEVFRNKQAVNRSRDAPRKRRAKQSTGHKDPWE